MAVRDRLVAILLAAGVLVGMASWQAVAPWLGVLVVIASVVAACAVYRLDRRHPVDPRSEPEDDLSRPRRAAGRL